MGSNEGGMLSFVHLSDPHLRKSPENTINGVKPYRRLEETIESIEQLEYKPKFVIITGDLSQDGTIQGYQQLKKNTDRLENQNILTLLTFGNNDKMENYRQVYQPPKKGHILNYAKTIDGIRVIVLDSSVPGKETGYFTADQLKWLNDVLLEDPEQPTVIAFHHPINLPQIKLIDINYDEAQRHEFYTALEGSNIIAVLNGHLHHNQTTIVKGILHSQAASILSELSYNNKEYWMRNKSSYNYMMYRNNSLNLKTVSIPCDGRVIQKGLLKTLVEEHLKPK